MKSECMLKRSTLRMDNGEIVSERVLSLNTIQSFLLTWPLSFWVHITWDVIQFNLQSFSLFLCALGLKVGVWH